MFPLDLHHNKQTHSKYTRPSPWFDAIPSKNLALLAKKFDKSDVKSRGKLHEWDIRIGNDVTWTNFPEELAILTLTPKCFKSSNSFFIMQVGTLKCNFTKTFCLTTNPKWGLVTSNMFSFFHVLRKCSRSTRSWAACWSMAKTLKYENPKITRSYDTPWLISASYQGNQLFRHYSSVVTSNCTHEMSSSITLALKMLQGEGRDLQSLVPL